MKTSMDVIQRIQWDSDLPAEYFYVGYIDRFKGIQVRAIFLLRIAQEH